MKLSELTDIRIDEADVAEATKMSWYISRRGYVTSSTHKNGVSVKTYLHRLIMKPEGGRVVDHINGDKLDNCRINLRVCSQAENTYNQTLRKDNNSGHKGVYLITKKGLWWAYITYKGKRTSLGYYKNIEDAISARVEAEGSYFGKFRREAAGV